MENKDGEILNIIRTDNDESNMGPTLYFTNNQIISYANNFSAAARITLKWSKKIIY
jgi:hypothetical protein